MKFRDRTEAGKLLAKQLQKFSNQSDVVIFGLPRGGVPVAYEVAMALNAPLDVFLVRKLGVPWHEELAMGAIALGGARVLNQEVINELHISQEAVQEVLKKEHVELERRNHVYRKNRPLPEVKNSTIILVDDGIATGATMRAAITALKQQPTKCSHGAHQCS